MTVYQAAEKVKAHVLQTINSETVVQKTGVVGISGDIVLHFGSEGEAIRANGGDGWLFKYIYRYGQVEITPIGG